MPKFAVIKNNVIIEVLTLETEDEIRQKIQTSEVLIDISSYLVEPSIGWVLNGNTLEIPQNQSSREQFEIELNARKADFGTTLAKNAVNKIGARNKILNKTGQQVTALLTALLGIKALLETGALGTARASCVQLKFGYTEYTDIFDEVINEINSFEIQFGL